MPRSRFKTCFISAPFGADTSVLRKVLEENAISWSNPRGSQEVAYFVQRLHHRGCDHGILLAKGGITGVAEDLTQAHFEIATALGNGIRVLVLTPVEVLGLANTDELVSLLKQKLCQLVVSGTTIP